MEECAGEATAVLGLTMSYHPGILMPMFWCWSAIGHLTVSLRFRTTVIGIDGAFGNMNLVSRNFFSCRHISGRKDLQGLSIERSLRRLAYCLPSRSTADCQCAVRVVQSPS